MQKLVEKLKENRKKSFEKIYKLAERQDEDLKKIKSILLKSKRRMVIGQRREDIYKKALDEIESIL